MTLPELMVTMLVGMVVIFAAYAALQATTAGQTRVADRVDSVARGRIGMERITRSLRQASCLPSNTTGTGVDAVETGPYRFLEIGTDEFVEFYTAVNLNADAGNRGQQWSAHRIEWQQTSSGNGDFNDGGPPVGNIIEKIYTSKDKTASYGFPIVPNQVNQLAEGVQKQVDGAGTTLPIFRYYGRDSVNPGQLSSTPLQLVNVSGATSNNPNKRPKLPDASLDRVAMFEVAYAARPRRATIAPSRTQSFFNRVSVRTADVYSGGTSVCPAS